MRYDFRNHPKKEIPKKTPRKAKARPIMPILHHVQRIPLEIHRPVKVHLVERLHRDLRLAPIPTPITLRMKL